MQVVSPGSFAPEQHFYARVLNATIHPMVSHFLHFEQERLMSRFCHLNPLVEKDALREVLTYKPRYLRWAGADLIHVTTAAGARRMVVIEVNSSPSGQKSMPLLQEHKEQGGYRFLMEHTLGPMVTKSRRAPDGRLAVIYDKNQMEASGYAAAMADFFKTDVFLAPCFDSELERPVRFTEGLMEVRTPDGVWHPVKAALRYVTQKPWNRIPLLPKTLMLNPTIACLAGGRNKMVAAMAYDIYNAELKGSGLSIRVPETIRDVRKEEVPLIIRQFGGHAAVKIPYSNAGQGVFTVTNDRELEAFMDNDYPYDEFIVQSLIGNYKWSSEGALGKFYHVGTVPNRANDIYVADVRLMVGAGPDGFRPIAIYARRAPHPLSDTLDEQTDSWGMLGTNLSVKKGVDTWDSDTGRLSLMDRKDFNQLGLSLDSLIEAFIQTVLSIVAIDKMACTLVNQKGKFRMKLFRSMNPDQPLLDEILR